MSDYSIIETKPVNLAVILVLFVLLLCAAGASAVYYTKSNLLEIELVNERQRLTRMTLKVDHLESKADVMQTNYVDLILTGYMRVGPRDMRDLVQTAKGLRTASKSKGPEMVGVGGGEEPLAKSKMAKPKPQPKKSKRKGKKSRRKASPRQ